MEWGYTDEHGNAIRDAMMFWDPPKLHEYPAPGVYTLIARPGLQQARPVSTRVTVRAKLRPEATFELLPGSRSVRAVLEHLDDEVQYRVAWGDGHVSEHHADDLAPTHVYGPGITRPQITVTDLPARRSASFDGPELPDPPPPPAQVDGFFFEHVHSTDTNRRFRFRGGGITPGATVTWYPYGVEWFRHLTADENGEVEDFVDIPIQTGAWADTDRRWRTYTVKHEGHVTHVPLHPPRCERGEPDVTYQIHVDGDPNTVLLSVTSPMLGQHHIDFGDGTATDVTAERLPLAVKHTYRAQQNSSFLVKITLPDGRTAQGTVKGKEPCPPCFNVNYPGRCDVCWWTTGNWCGQCGGDSSGDANAFAPVIIDNHFHPVHQLHRPIDGSAWHVTYGYGGFPVGVYTFDYRTAFANPWSYDVNITAASKFKQPPAIDLVEKDCPPAPPGALTQSFHVDDVSQPSRYTAFFMIRNHSVDHQPWELEFTLAAPAVLKDVKCWWGEAVKTGLGDGRWRITGRQPLRPGANDSTRLDIEVDPCGDPRVWPTDMSLPPTPRSPSE